MQYWRAAGGVDKWLRQCKDPYSGPLYTTVGKGVPAAVHVCIQSYGDADKCRVPALCEKFLQKLPAAGGVDYRYAGKQGSLPKYIVAAAQIVGTGKVQKIGVVDKTHEGLKWGALLFDILKSLEGVLGLL